MTMLSPLRGAARHALKQAGGRIAATALPQCDFARAVFLFGHMRCGSTAVSNVLCTRPEVSGYGEAHITYNGAAALGRLVINQQRRGAWKPGARYLFDKVLHSAYDREADPGLAQARAVFLIRAPQGAILSIRTLFAALSSTEYATDGQAADYYERRLETLGELWLRFPRERRAGTSYAALTAAPDAFLAQVSTLLSLDPPLANHYAPSNHAARPGAGDPLSSHRFSAIVAPERSSSLGGNRRQLDLAPGHVDRLVRLHDDLVALFHRG